MSLIPYVIFLGIMIYAFVYCIKFLLRYRRLKTYGIETKGVINTSVPSRNLFSKNALMPKITFFTKENNRIDGFPRHTFFFELTGYRIKQEYKVFYFPPRPELFIVENLRELILTGMTLFFSLVIIVVLLQRIFFLLTI